MMSRYSLVADRCLSSHEQETERARGAWAFAIANPSGIMITSGRQRTEFMPGQISLIIFASLGKWLDERSFLSIPL